MVKPVLYIYENGELIDVIYGLKHTLKYLRKLSNESHTKTSIKKVARNSRKI